ncbi:DEKNAAC105227 [Brettanomyces naardenensis]|uniref:DEKNAAC105227 n=1 Tax=Brettanomyces naardenensis TaxID=13370 RepID=A0A448YT07_BRENA|nr:DEKNAAC105227 [Brettanomyces naardenensis]
MSCSDVQEIYALFKDISVNEAEYLSYLSGTPGLVIPDGLMELFEEVMTYTDDSFTTLFSTMAESEYDQIDDMITALPWYSTRLLPEITADDGVCTSSGSGVTTGTSGTVSQTSSTSNVSGADTTTTYETITTTISDKTTTYVTTYCPKCQSTGSASDTTYETITTTISDETTTYVTTYCPKCHASSSLAGGETVVTTVSDETTTYVTTYCPEGKSSLSPEETTVKTIIQDYTTVVTTYCPKCTSKTSATASGSASSLPTAQKVSTFEASANSIKTPGSVLAGVIFLLYLLH